MPSSKRTLENELNSLSTAPIVDLRRRWGELFRAEQPKAFGPDLLRQCIAKRIQENAVGRLPKQSQLLLDQLIKSVAAKPNGRLEMPRRIKPGSELVRTWKGKSHRVVVRHDGFRYGTKTYPSLSEIATLIAGSRWNGPRFFGLRAAAGETSSDGK